LPNISKINQEKLFQEVPKFERFFRILTENSLVAYQQRVLDNLSLSAEERYQHFCQKYPSLVQTLPQKEIASYIGVTRWYKSCIAAACWFNVFITKSSTPNTPQKPQNPDQSATKKSPVQYNL